MGDKQVLKFNNQDVPLDEPKRSTVTWVYRPVASLPDRDDTFAEARDATECYRCGSQQCEWYKFKDKIIDRARDEFHYESSPDGNTYHLKISTTLEIINPKKARLQLYQFYHGLKYGIGVKMNRHHSTNDCIESGIMELYPDI